MKATTDLTFGIQYVTICYPDKDKDVSIRLRFPNWFQRQVWKYFLGWKLEFD